MIMTDFQTIEKYAFNLSVIYNINNASKVGRVGKKFADAKFAMPCFHTYACTFGFNDLNTANACRDALLKAFEGVDAVQIDSVKDPYMERVKAQIARFEEGNF